MSPCIPSIFYLYIQRHAQTYLISYIDYILIYSNPKPPLSQRREMWVAKFSTQLPEYTISQEGVIMDKAKIQIVVELPTPQIIKDLQRVLGFFDFSLRFIQNFNLMQSLSHHSLWEDQIKYFQNKDYGSRSGFQIFYKNSPQPLFLNSLNQVS